MMRSLSFFSFSSGVTSTLALMCSAALGVHGQSSAQVAYALEDVGTAVSATCLPSSLYPNGAAQPTGPLPLLATGFSLTSRDGCAGGVTIDESYMTLRIYSTDGQHIFRNGNPLYSPPGGFGLPVAPSSARFGGIAVQENGTMLYLVGGRTLYRYSLTTLSSLPPINLDGFLSAILRDGTCLTGLDFDKSSRVLVATDSTGVVVAFTTAGVPIGTGLVANMAGLVKAPVTGLAIDDSAFAGIASTACGANPVGLHLLSAGDSNVVGDARIVGVRLNGTVAYSMPANEATAFPCGLSAVADAQVAGGGGGGGLSTTLSSRVTAPFTQMNLTALGGTQVNYEVSATGPFILYPFFSTSCLGPPVSTTLFTAYITGGFALPPVLPSPPAPNVSTIPIGALMPGFEIFGQVSQAPGGVLTMSDCYYLRISR